MNIERRRQPAPQRSEEGSAMTDVRESSRFGFCYALGELITETATRYIYRNRAGVAYVNKNAPLIHIAPCAGCADYDERAGLGHSTQR